MGRACDCCGDDAVCDGQIPCQICFDDQCNKIELLNNIDEYVSIIVAVYNRDDDNLNSCPNDERNCSFEETDYKFSIHIGPYFGNDVGENSKYVKAMYDDLKYSTEIGETFPFIDSESCGATFEPVCKCITPTQVRVNNYELVIFEEGEDGAERILEQYPRTYGVGRTSVVFEGKFLTKKETDKIFGTAVYPCDAPPEDDEEPPIELIEGYLVKCGLTQRQCDRIGGQFIYEDDPSDCECYDPELDPTDIRTISYIDYVKHTAFVDSCKNTQETVDALDSEVNEYGYKIERVTGKIGTEDRDYWVMEDITVLNPDETIFSKRTGQESRVSEKRYDPRRWGIDELYDYLLPYGYVDYYDGEIYQKDYECKNNARSYLQTFEPSTSEFTYQPTEEVPFEELDGWYVYTVPSQWQLADLYYYSTTAAEADNNFDIVADWFNQHGGFDDSDRNADGAREGVCSVYVYRYYLHDERRVFRHEDCDEYIDYTKYTVAGGGGRRGVGGAQRWTPNDPRAGNSAFQDPIPTGYGTVEMTKYTYEKVPNNEIWEFGDSFDGVQVVSWIGDRDFNENPAIDGYFIETDIYYSLRDTNIAVDNALYASIRTMNHCCNCVFTDGFRLVADVGFGDAGTVGGRNRSGGFFPHTHIKNIVGDISDTFDPTLDPEAPEISRTKISVTIVASSQSAVSKIKAAIESEDPDNSPDCESFCNYMLGGVRFDFRHEVLKAIEEEQIIFFEPKASEEEGDGEPEASEEDSGPPKMRHIFESHTDSCDLTTNISNNNSYSVAGVLLSQDDNTVEQEVLGQAIYLRAPSPFYGAVEVYNYAINGNQISGPTTEFSDINNNRRNVTAKLLPLSPQFKENAFAISPLDFYQIATADDFQSAAFDYQHTLYSFKMFEKCTETEASCCSIENKLEGVSVILTLSGIGDFLGKIPLDIDYQYFIPRRGYLDTNKEYIWRTTHPNNNSKYGCTFQLTYPTNPISYNVTWGGIQIGMVGCGGYGTNNWDGLSVSDGVGYHPLGQYIHDTVWGVALDHEKLSYDCEYDITVTHKRAEDTTIQGFNNPRGSDPYGVSTTYQKIWDLGSPYDGVTDLNSTLPSRVIDDEDDLDNRFILNIVYGTQSGPKSNSVYAFTPYLITGDDCRWVLNYTNSNPLFDPFNSQTGALRYSEDGYGIGKMATQINSLPVPVVKGFYDPDSECVYTVYTYGVTTTSTYIGYYANGTNDTSTCAIGYKKWTPEDWMVGTRDRSCAGFISRNEYPFGTLVNEPVLAQHAISTQVGGSEVGADPRSDFFLQPIGVLRTKHSTAKNGSVIVDFQNIEKVGRDDSAYYYVAGPQPQTYLEIDDMVDSANYLNGSGNIETAIESIIIERGGSPAREFYDKLMGYDVDASSGGFNYRPLRGGVDIRFRFIDQLNMELQISYISEITAYNFQILGESLDILGSHSCADQCCVQHIYDPLRIIRGNCLGGDGVAGSVSNGIGPAGWDHWRKTALFNATANKLAPSFHIAGFEFRIIRFNTTCEILLTGGGKILSDDNVEEEIYRFDNSNSLFSFLVEPDSFGYIDNIRNASLSVVGDNQTLGLSFDQPPKTRTWVGGKDFTNLNDFFKEGLQGNTDAPLCGPHSEPQGNQTSELQGNAICPQAYPNPLTVIPTYFNKMTSVRFVV